MTNDEDLIGSAKAAQILGWHQRTVQRAATTGAIPIVGTLGARQDLIFRQSEIEKLAQEQETKSELDDWV